MLYKSQENKYSGPDVMGSTRKQDHVRDEEHENVRALISRPPQSCYTGKHKKKLPESNKGIGAWLDRSQLPIIGSFCLASMSI